MYSIDPIEQRAWISQSEDDCCRMCRSYFAWIGSQQTRTLERMNFHNMRQLMDSARDGCHLCSLIVSEIPPPERQRYLEELDREGEAEPQIKATIWYSKLLDGSLPPVPYLRLEEAKLRPQAFGVDIICEFECQLLEDERQMRRLLRRVQPSTGSWETFNDIHYWLRMCEMTHTKCAQSRREQSRQMPTRLVQVGAFDPGPQVYLRHFSQIPQGSKYATLSHCWGQHMPVKLEQNTLQRFSEGIDIATLPRTFREAIGLTKALGLDYLWIDSLCIIQDSPDDWAYECTRMSSVYMGSFVNIGANVSADSDGGLFCQRSWKSVNALAVRLTYAPIRWRRKPIVLYPRRVRNLIDHAPLGSRAWVVQERLLAPRTVHFLQDKVVWECEECLASESDVTGELEQKSSVKNTCLARPIVTHNNETSARDQFLDQWAGVVNLYSSGKLSVATDKLIAISGVARYMQSILLGDEPLQYYAGHWSHDFEIQLTWSPSQSNIGNRPQTYIAPSWSWASYDGEVSFPLSLFEGKLFASLIHVDIRPASDSFGAVLSGFIRMRGPLCRAIATHVNSPSDQEKPSTLRLLEPGVDIECDELIFDEANDAEIIEDGTEQQNYFVMFGVVQNTGSGKRPLEGILLRLTGLQKGQYRRIGYFRVENNYRAYSSEDEQSDLDVLIDAFAAMDMPESSFEQKGNGWYEFTII